MEITIFCERRSAQSKRLRPASLTVFVKADNESLKEFTFSCHKQETTAHALFKVNLVVYFCNFCSCRQASRVSFGLPDLSRKIERDSGCSQSNKIAIIQLTLSYSSV